MNKNNRGICKIRDCGTPAWAKTLCKPHYMRVWRYGDAEFKPDKIQNLTLSRRRRSERELREKLSIFADADSCWEWPGFINPKTGYGMYGDSEKCAHRAVYGLLVGEIPEGLVIDHLCRNRACVNPKHMEPVTYRENLLRGKTLAAENHAKTHCKHGHEFTLDNTYIRPLRAGRGKERACKQCYRLANERHHMKKMELSRG